jgi:hypothetical protein
VFAEKALLQSYSPSCVEGEFCELRRPLAEDGGLPKQQYP